MRLIGMAERALELMCQRAFARETFGKILARHVSQHFVTVFVLLPHLQPHPQATDHGLGIRSDLTIASSPGH